jgi:hypothetical protein
VWISRASAIPWSDVDQNETTFRLDGRGRDRQLGVAVLDVDVRA